MPSMITEVEDFFAKGCGRCDRFDTPECSTKRWAKGLAALRRVCLEAGLEEQVKWGHPCYVHAGRNIAIIGAFRDDFRLSFFNAALMKDPEGVLERAGPNTQNPGMIRFAANDDVAAREGVVLRYLQEAIGYAELGIKPPKDARVLDLPEELVEAMDADPALSEAFHALTRGRRNSYVVNLNGAAKPETRYARIARFRDRIIAGKGANER